MDAEKRKQYKKTHFDKIKAKAQEIECKCGCGQKLLDYDNYGRKHEYVSGHNGRKHHYYEKHKDEVKEKAKKAKIPRGKRIKGELVAEKGGKCMSCELKYDGNNACVFQFHHRDPKEKKFNVTTGTINDKNMSVIREEIEKCDLLCGNCHALYHGGGY